MMSNLPQELVELIVDYHERDITTLCNLALVSTMWTPRSQQHIFNRVSFDAPKLRLSAQESQDYMTSKWLAFQDAILNYPHLGLLVHHLQFSPGWSRNQQNLWVHNSSCHFEQVLSTLPNVQSLSLNLNHLSWSLLEPLAQPLQLILRNISSLEIRDAIFKNCSGLHSLIFQCLSLKELSLHAISNHGEWNPPGDEIRLRLQSFSISKFPCNDPFVFSKWFHSPAFDVQELCHLSMDSPMLYTVMIKECYRTLTSLELYKPAREPLSQLLCDAPLASLTIRFEEDNVHRWIPALAEYLAHETSQRLQQLFLVVNLGPSASSFIQWQPLDFAFEKHGHGSLRRLVFRFAKLLPIPDRFLCNWPIQADRATSMEMRAHLPATFQTFEPLLEFEEFSVPVLKTELIQIIRKAYSMKRRRQREQA